MKSNPKNEVVGIDSICKVFGDNSGETVAVRDITLTAKRGELLVILGPSGSGKTTLLTLIAGLVEASSGRVALFGKDIATYSRGELQRVRANRIGFIFQTFLLMDYLTALENVALVRQFAGKGRGEAAKEADRILGQLGVEHLTDKYPGKMSQGEKQRVSVARALVNDPDLILADEPTASLEAKQGLQVIHRLHEYAHEQNRCVIVASHDLRIKDVADRVLYIEDGEIKQKEESRTLSSDRGGGSGF
jgi:putative ABC transport system ATP-binding protein